MPSQSQSPSIERIAEVARALGELSEKVVFIGGAIAPLLQTHPTIQRVRPTKDVDAVLASTHYTKYHATQTRLRELGFTIDISDAKHAHRWRSPGGTTFDLVPAGEHLGGTGNRWDKIALETAIEAEIEPGLRILHVNASGFLALKWAAFWDRGASDPFLSHDLEDILALIVSRDSIGSEFKKAPQDVQVHIRKGLRWLIDNAAYEDLVAGHLANAQSFRHVSQLLRERIGQMIEIPRIDPAKPPDHIGALRSTLNLIGALKENGPKL